MGQQEVRVTPSSRRRRRLERIGTLKEYNNQQADFKITHRRSHNRPMEGAQRTRKQLGGIAKRQATIVYWRSCRKFALLRAKKTASMLHDRDDDMYRTHCYAI